MANVSARGSEIKIDAFEFGSPPQAPRIVTGRLLAQVSRGIQSFNSNTKPYGYKISPQLSRYLRPVHRLYI